MLQVSDDGQNLLNSVVQVTN